MRTKIGIGIGIFLLVILILRFVFYKYEDVPDVDWNTRYDMESKEPGGLWVFKNLLDLQFGTDNVIVDNAFEIEKYDTVPKYLLLTIQEDLTFGYVDVNQIEEFVRKGNMVVLIANSIHMLGANVNIENKPKFILEDTLNLNYPDSKEEFGTFKNHSSSFKNASLFHFGTFMHEQYDTLINLSPLLLAGLNDTIAHVMSIGKGKIITHSLPRLFTNSSAIQEYYQEHYNHILADIDATKVIISKPKNKDIFKESPLSVLLENRSFAAAYYGLLICLLTLLVFGSKRKQNPIPIIEPLRNTSLEYADAISNLHQFHGSNEEMVGTLEQNFHDKMKKQFNVNRSSENFVQRLAQKMNVEESQIIDMQEKINKYKVSCSDKEFLSLRNLIVNFEKIVTNG